MTRQRRCLPENSDACRINIEMMNEKIIEFFIHIGKHLIMRRPRFFRCIEIVSSSRTEHPFFAVILARLHTYPLNRCRSRRVQSKQQTLRGLASGLATMNPYIDAKRCTPDLVMKSCSVHPKSTS